MPEKTPLYDVASQAGALFVEESGWLMPAHYGQATAENQSACQEAALFDTSHHGKVEVKGPDARTFLHNLCTCDVAKLTVSVGCEAFLTTGQAKIVAYVLIFRHELAEGQDILWLDAGPGMGVTVTKHLDRYLISERVELADRTREFAQFHLAGPKARAVLKRCSHDNMPDFGELQHGTQLVADVACPIRRHDRLGLPGFDILCFGRQAESVWQALSASGARPAGLEAYHLLRVEAGMPVYGKDIDDTNLPQEVGRMDRTISFTKGCYIGQETVARIRTYGHVNRSLVGLKLTGVVPALQGTKLFRDGKEVGQITSSVFSPRLGIAIAMAYVRRGNQESGTALKVEVEGERRTAEVTTLPFVRYEGGSP